jgi:hypothetical protein
MKCNLKNILIEENVNKYKFLEELEIWRSLSLRPKEFKKFQLERIFNNGSLTLEDALIISKAVNRPIEEIWYIEGFEFLKSPTKHDSRNATLTETTHP